MEHTDQPQLIPNVLRGLYFPQQEDEFANSQEQAAYQLIYDLRKTLKNRNSGQLFFFNRAGEKLNALLVLCDEFLNLSLENRQRNFQAFSNAFSEIQSQLLKKIQFKISQRSQLKKIENLFQNLKALSALSDHAMPMILTS